jgi:FeS assembly SUF system protein
MSKVELQEQIVEQLKLIFDPEIPVNIYDLGLIYDVKVDDDNIAQITMTLTSPGCPVAGSLPGEVGEAAKKVEGIVDAKVELTFDPPWDQQMMPEFVKLELGLF